MTILSKVEPSVKTKLAHYSGASVFIGGRLLAETAQVTLEKKSSSSPIYTVAAGFAGISLGASQIELTVENAVPARDFEYNVDWYIRVGFAVEVGVVMANRQSVFNGFITEATYTHSVNEAAKLNFKMICRFGDFE